jgi:hypothetical protein
VQVVKACALYKSEDEQQKAFQFMHCWNKLRTQPKWLAKFDKLVAAKTSNKRQKTVLMVMLLQGYQVKQEQVRSMA